MMRALPTRPLYPGEYALALALAAVLPLLEAPKNLVWVAWVALWLFNSVKHGNLREARGTDALFVATIAAPVLACAFAAPWSAHWPEVPDVVRYASIGWVLSRTQLTGPQAGTLLAVLLASAVVAGAQGWWVWQVSHQHKYLELHSVGHVNHSALYLATVATGAFMAYLAAPGGGRIKAACGAGFCVLGGLVFASESRGAAAMMLLITAVLLVVYYRAHGRRLWPALTALVLLTAGALAASHELVDKIQRHIRADNITAWRVELAATATEAFRAHPLTGIGPGNFRSLTAVDVERWVDARGGVYAPERYHFSSHAHTLYFNTLAERGLVGLAALAALLAVWGGALVQRRPAPGRDTDWLLWSASAASFGLVLIGGWANTSLHSENALLAMIGFGLLLGSVPPPLQPDMTNA